MAKIKSNAEIFDILFENRKNFNIFNIEEFEPSLKEGIKLFCQVNEKQDPNMFLEFLFNPLCPEKSKGDKQYAYTILFGFLSCFLKKKPDEVCNLVMDEIDLQVLKHQKNERINNRK